MLNLTVKSQQENKFSVEVLEKWESYDSMLWCCCLIYVADATKWGKALVIVVVLNWQLG